ncbi:MAG: sigma-70 family RNA polymerase sigma factor [Coleofasciculaceae cyanobacterium SM2_1_6]|nr:sigma-70 family RNA polymerase sigma factor [Coleofasciculaceae cyanobacterium SM2_1_6]
MEINAVEPAIDGQEPAIDAALVGAMRQGESSALGKLYDRYSSLVYRLALRILASPPEAEDLTQEIFLNLWHNQTYDPRRGSLSSYLTTLTRSRAIDKLRSRTTQGKFLQRWSQALTTAPSPPSPFDLASLEQRSTEIHQALSLLADKHRQVLELAYYEGLSQSEIAARLKTPLGTVKSWSRQGLLQLRKNLKDVIS